MAIIFNNVVVVDVFRGGETEVLVYVSLCMLLLLFVSLVVVFMSYLLLHLHAVPEEFLSPSLSLLNATSILVVWTPPLRPNGLILSYQVTRATVGSTPITTSHDLSTMAILTELSPFTLYLVSVSVTNTEGTTVSPQANITTGETGKNKNYYT